MEELLLYNINQQVSHLNINFNSLSISAEENTLFLDLDTEYVGITYIGNAMLRNELRCIIKIVLKIHGYNYIFYDILFHYNG